MAKRKGKRKSAGAIAAPAVAELALQASYEIEALAKLLSKPGQDQEDAIMFVYVARGLGCRIKTLNGIIMSAVGESDIDEEDVRTYERELYG